MTVPQPPLPGSATVNAAAYATMKAVARHIAATGGLPNPETLTPQPALPYPARPNLAAFLTVSAEYLAEVPDRYDFLLGRGRGNISDVHNWFLAWANRYLTSSEKEFGANAAPFVIENILWGSLLYGVEKGWSDELLATCQKARVSFEDLLLVVERPDWESHVEFLATFAEPLFS